MPCKVTRPVLLLLGLFEESRKTRKNIKDLFEHANPQALLTLSSLASEDFFFLDFPGDCAIFSTFVGGYKNTAIAEKREDNPEILTN